MYKITLTHTIFDSENDNVILFNNKDELKTYWDNLNDKITIPNINFMAGDIINTEIVLNIPVGLVLLNLLNYNYCIVENEKETLFFFIENSSQLNANQIRLRLKIDIWNTYIYDINNMQGLAVRCHRDRFKKVSPGKYVFNFDKSSCLFERENLRDLSKRPIKKFKLEAQYDTTSSSNFNKWINENIECWKYYYISAGKEYNYTGYDYENNLISTTRDLPEIIYDNGWSDIEGDMIVLYAPVYKTSKDIKFAHLNSTKTITWTESAIKSFLEQNNNNANVFSIKISPISPFQNAQYDTDDYYIDSSGNLILVDNYNPSFTGILRDNGYNGDGQLIIKGLFDYCRNSKTNTYAFTGKDGSVGFGLIIRQHIDQNIKFSIPQEMYKILYTDEEILNEDLEPKIYNEDYSVYRLYFGGEEYELPVSKTSNKPNFIYKEILNPDITKSILIFNPNDEEDLINSYYDTIFNEYSTKDFTGLITTLDLSVWFSVDKLDEYLANNKNNLQILRNQQSERIITTAVSGIASIGTGAVASAVTGNPIGIVGGIAQAVTNITNTGISNAYEKANYNLTLDNMRNSKQSLQNLNSNAILMSSVDEFGLYIELEQAIEFELERVKDYLKMFGYSYNRIVNFEEINKTRRYYNYIEMLVYEIDAKISSQAKDRLKEIFSNGVRIWHADEFKQIDYTLNNIERSVIYGE